jgi:hypothetical protein
MRTKGFICEKKDRMLDMIKVNGDLNFGSERRTDGIVQRKGR